MRNIYTPSEPRRPYGAHRYPGLREAVARR